MAAIECRKDVRLECWITSHDATNLRFVWVADGQKAERTKEGTEGGGKTMSHGTTLGKRNETTPAPAPRMGMARQPYPDRSPPRVVATWQRIKAPVRRATGRLGLGCQVSLD